MTSDPLELYRRQIERELHPGNATEHTHRPALKTLIESLAPGATATNEPKRVECGAPDFIVSRRTAHGPVTIGYIEAKDVDKDLSEIERTDQLKRYLASLPNLIVTDYLEFRWYVDGESRGDPARLARLIRGGKLAPEKDGEPAVRKLLTGFLSHAVEPITKPKDLALRMARLTHFIRDIIIAAFDKESASATLTDLRSAFERALIPDLPVPQFADMFAQTLAYGLFAARVNHRGSRGSFKRLGAAAEIPKTNPFLRQLFETITGTALDDEPYVGFVDDLAQLLADTDIEEVLHNFGKRTARQDPVVHFYETFLAAYDPKLREARGVYYTPEPVVSYIVRSVDHLLKTRFACPAGLADTSTIEYENEPDAAPGQPVKSTSHRVLILDPACGTGTFLYAVIDLIREQFIRDGNAGMWSGYVRDHLLPRIFGFELLMAPYAVAHFKLGMELAGHDLTDALRKKWAYDFNGNERLGVYLTNTLEEAEHKAETLFGPFRVISDEANAAASIKRDLPILAVIGNPPYSGHSANRSWEILPDAKTKKLKRFPTFIGRLIHDYYQVDGNPLGEKNPKWLQDDYVKFIRWAQWRIERTGAGILAFISNHGYLDNPTFRGMRRSLMNAFSEVYILNLHGNSKKKEKCPDGSPDENVFDIQQGVTIALFIKQRGKPASVKVSYADAWGLRETKYTTLLQSGVNSTKWEAVEPHAPLYLFVPQEELRRDEYELGWSVNDIFPVHSVGIVTARDNLAIRWTREEMWRTVEDFPYLQPADARRKYDLPADAQDWKVKWAQEDLKEDGPARASIVPVLYRPFDTRYTYYTGNSMGFICRPRPEVMPHMLHGRNIGLVWTRPMSPNYEFSVLCTRTIVDQCAVGNKSAGAGISYLSPLYRYSLTDLDQKSLESPPGPVENLSPEFIAAIAQKVGLPYQSDRNGELGPSFGAEDVFRYTYAISYSPTYRLRYAEFLKTGLQRVPTTSDVGLFRALCAKGADLVSLHLLESPRLEKPIARYPVTGSNVIEKGFPKYLGPGEAERGTGQALKSGRVYINEDQFFEGVPPDVWNFHIGGYQVCEKWLKDRRGRTLAYDDQVHYAKVVTALSETIRLMAEIDAAIPSWPIR